MLKPQSQYGYTIEETLSILDDCKKYEFFNEDKFREALMGITGRLVDGIGYTYPSDVELAVKCGMGNRGQYHHEFD